MYDVLQTLQLQCVLTLTVRVPYLGAAVLRDERDALAVGVVVAVAALHTLGTDRSIS